MQLVPLQLGAAPPAAGMGAVFNELNKVGGWLYKSNECTADPCRLKGAWLQPLKLSSERNWFHKVCSKSAWFPTLET
jgi:hypothetical protein